MCDIGETFCVPFLQGRSVCKVEVSSMLVNESRPGSYECIRYGSCVVCPDNIVLEEGGDVTVSMEVFISF